MAQSAAGAPSHVDRSKVVGLLAVTIARKEEEGKVVPRSQIKGEAGALDPITKRYFQHKV